MTIFDSLFTENSSVDQILSTKPFDFDQINAQSAKETAPEWLWWAFFIEVVLILFSAFWAIFTTNIFYKNPLFHHNLVTLAISIVFLWWTMQLSRLIVCLGALFVDTEIQQNLSIFLVKPPFFLAEKFRVWSGYSAVTSMAAVIYERIVATKRLDFYERITSPIFVAFLIIGSWLTGFIGTVLIFHSPFTVVVSISIGTSFIIFVGVGYVGLQYRNRRQLRRSMLDSHYFNLSQSFQLKENLRVLIIIKRFVISFMGCLSVLFVLYTIGLFSQNLATTSNASTQLYVVRSFSNVMCDISGPLMIYSAITGTFVWRESLKKQLCDFFVIRRRTRIVPVIKSDEHLKNMDGQQLTFSVNEEQEIYFQQLKLAWA